MMFFPGISELVAGRALNTTPAGLAIAALAWLGLKAFGKQGSRTAFAVWFLALIGIATVPLVPSFSATTGTSAIQARVTLPGLWAEMIFGVWFAVAGVAAMRLSFGIWKVWRLKREASCILISELPAEAQRAIAEIRASRPVEVCTSAHVRVPMAVGFFRPTVLLPEWAMAELSDSDLTAVLLHELAHLRRRDDWTNLAQKVLGAIFFFHPAMWWVERKLALEREMACDELVLASTGNRQAYAECLVSLAEKSLALRGLALAQSVIGHAKSTALRLTRILSSGYISEPNSNWRVLAVATVALALCVLAAPGAPKWIAFENHATPDSAVAVTNSSPVVEPTTLAAPKIEASLHAASSHSDGAVRKPDASRLQPRAADRSATRNAIARTNAAPEPELMAGKADSDVSASGTQFLVVMQTTIDSNGEIKTNWRVWKLTLRESDNRLIRAQIVASTL
jgi:beta-lactamase regulating signal transducer with metallopeptidase domain